MQNRKRILIVDDEPLMNDFLCEALKRKKYLTETAMDGESALRILEKQECYLVITDLCLPDINGIELLKQIKKQNENIGVIVMTAYGSIENAVEAMKIGAFDYITKPFSIDQIDLIIAKYTDYHRLKNENINLKHQLEKKYSFNKIIGKSKAMQAVYKTITAVASSDSTILIQGASGTGKELVARAIHVNSQRREKPFITTNCAAWPETLVESELFGYMKGAFTGASQDKKGMFEDADCGTILLDEISEMSIALQAKLLRVLQEKEINRIGSSDKIKIDTRIIATTNKDLKKLVEKNEFREDLYFRLNVVPIRLPELKEKKEDIQFLTNHFLKVYAKKNRKNIHSIDNKVHELFMLYHWPGNVRELENLLERAIVMASDNETLTAAHFDDIAHEIKNKEISSITFVPDSEASLHDLEKVHILNTLHKFNGNKTKASKILGISVRTLRNKLKEYNSE